MTNEKTKSARLSKAATPGTEGSRNIRLQAIQQPMRRVNPLGMRVLVRIGDTQDVSDGGLYLPEGARQSMSESLLAEVLEVASAVDSSSSEETEETNVSGIPLGAKVLIKKNSGVRVPWDDTLRIVDTAEVLAVVTEIEII